MIDFWRREGTRRKGAVLSVDFRPLRLQESSLACLEIGRERERERERKPDSCDNSWSTAEWGRRRRRRGSGERTTDRGVTDLSQRMDDGQNGRAEEGTGVTDLVRMSLKWGKMEKNPHFLCEQRQELTKRYDYNSSKYLFIIRDWRNFKLVNFYLQRP